jgi:hypothetical protein
VKNAALGNDAVVDKGAGVVCQAHGAPTEPGKQILEEMNFQKSVEEHNGDDQRTQQVVPQWYKRERVEQQAVGAAGGPSGVQAIPRQHGRGILGLVVDRSVVSNGG